MPTDTAAQRRQTILPFSLPGIGDDEIKEVVDTLRSQWLTTGPKTRRFEEEFAAAFDAQAALAVNSCTAALHLALAALGVGPGDEVITTPMTFVASVNVIEHVGARPVLADVEADTLNIDPDRVEAALTPRTRAILPVHFAGHPAELDTLLALAEHAGLAVVEDAAHAVAARYRGRWIGSGPNPVAFSFYATKNLTTGEGGMLTGASALLERARLLSLHGMSRDAWRRYDNDGGWRYDVIAPGFKYNMSDIQASLGLVQLRRLTQMQRRRREIAERYSSAFAGNDALELPVERPLTEHAWHLYVLRLRTEALRIDRDRFVEELRARRIGVSVHFIPIHVHTHIRRTYGYAPDDFPVAYSNYLRLVSLPLYPALSDQDVEDVIDAVLDIVEEFRR